MDELETLVLGFERMASLFLLLVAGAAVAAVLLAAEKAAAMLLWGPNAEMRSRRGIGNVLVDSAERKSEAVRIGKYLTYLP